MKEIGLKDACKTCIEQLFYGTRSEPSKVVDDAGPYILLDEVREAIKLMKEGKSPEPDNINTEFIKHLDDDSVTWMISVFNRIFISGKIPHDWP
ncbi:hypothetical protein Trydic_g4169 [Trypoxylus dichotomus]